ncbi:MULTISPECIES: DUF4129 domain-containing protein [unclassified Streptomyces]|uniref:DUF4129 domain-containing protein n=1 Tax=unclassified Streptomyces TaxID=2593676 RepID=UPI0027E2A002|nr:MULTISPECIES: DUF4129 domain-containing protein [unclassified Streptomyces]MDU0304275.1 DUF4129 domain-containing protein [Streptomyces sp. PAL114]
MGRERTADGRRRHGTVGAARAALTVLVVAGLALAALLLRPDAGLLAKGSGPLGGNPVLVFGLALLAFFGGLSLREKYRQRVDAAGELDPVRERVTDAVSRVLLGASLVVPLLVLVLHRFGSSGDAYGPGADDGLDASPFPSPAQDATRTLPPPRNAGDTGDGLDLGLTRILVGLGIALLVVVVVIAGLRLWRHLTRPSAPEVTATYATLDDERERLARAVDFGRRALSDGDDARAAVIACYAAMEQSLADSGVTRRASDSPQDLLERAVAGGLPTEAAAATLTALFREARYSTHPMDAGHRDRAAAALAEIADGLRARASEPEAVGGTS